MNFQYLMLTSTGARSAIGQTRHDRFPHCKLSGCTTSAAGVFVTLITIVAVRARISSVAEIVCRPDSQFASIAIFVSNDPADVTLIVPVPACTLSSCKLVSNKAAFICPLSCSCLPVPDACSPARNSQDVKKPA